MKINSPTISYFSYFHYIIVNVFWRAFKSVNWPFSPLHQFRIVSSKGFGTVHVLVLQLVNQIELCIHVCVYIYIYIYIYIYMH